jgi:phenylpyruvate tautomerase PptA (4-oxalocrotonate tautomerase family)
MPVVTIESWKGKSLEQKSKLINGIRKAFEDIGVDPASLTIIMRARYTKIQLGKRGKTSTKEP